MSDSFDAKLIKAGQGHTPWKGACRVVATGNVTLSGLQTIDGVLLVAGNRVLCVGQTDPKRNGVYSAQAGAWARDIDLSVSRYWWLGVSIMVLEGTTNGGSLWTLTSPTTGRIELGATELEFSQVVAGDGDIEALRSEVTAIDARVDALVPVLTAVRAVLTTGGALSGSTADGVTLQAGDRVLNAPTAAATAAGIYTVPVGLGAWTRAADMPAAATIGLGALVSVLEGSASNVGLWGLASPTTGAPVIGTAPLLFQRIAALEPAPDPPWEPSQLTSVTPVFFADFADASLRTMTGTRVDALANAIDVGVPTIARTVGTNQIDSSVLLNGDPAFRNDATTFLGSISGGPVGNQAWGFMCVTTGNDASPEAFARVGALGGSGGIGVTVPTRYAAGRPSQEGVPNGAPPTPVPNGTAQLVGAQHLPQYGQLAVTVEGRFPQAASGASWVAAKTFANDGSFGFGRIESAGSANTSRIYKGLWWIGEMSARERVLLADYFARECSLARLPGYIKIVGDSNSTEVPSSPATVSWVTHMTALLTAQLAIDARVMPVIHNVALAGKYCGGDWALQGTASPTMAHQCDGNYVAFVGAPSNNQGLHQTPPYSITGLSAYNIAIEDGCTNDFINGNITGAQAIDRRKYNIEKLTEAGFYVISQTVLPGSSNSGYYGDGSPGTREVHRDTLNDWVINQAVSFGSRRIINREGAITWPTHFSGDVVHLDNSGHVIAGNLAYAQVEAAIREDLDP